MRHTLIYFLLLCFMGITANSLGQNTVGTLINTTNAQDGYILFEYMGDTSIYLIDPCGRVVNQWSSDYTAGTSVYLQEDGSIVRAGKTPTTTFPVGGQGGVIEKIDWDDNLLWQFFYSDSLHSFHHDVEVLPNGNILALAFERITRQQAIDAGRDSTLISEDELWPEILVELQPIGTDSAVIVWEWRMWDHLIQDFDSSKANYGVVEEHPERFDLNFMDNPIADWAHANSIDYNPSLDQVVISLNFFDEFVIIDHSTSTLQAATSSGGNSGKGGDILYRYGNPAAYRHGDSLDQVNFRQHCVEWVPDGLSDEGKIMFYNNGNGRPTGAYSSVEIITPLVDSSGAYILEADTTFGPDSAEWMYTAPIPTDFYSPMISGAQRLPNGNTLICQGRDGRLFEIAPNDSIVWEYWSPVYNLGVLTQGQPITGNRNVFRTLKYPTDFTGFVGRDLTPGAPLELNPDLSACLTVGLEMVLEEKSYRVYPNPFEDVLTIELPKNSNAPYLEIYTAFGSLVKREVFKESIDVSNLESGLYLICIDGHCKKVIKE